ncbi:MAG: class I SAM-dependent methyltransferase [Candidatus Altiarchaeota archaeon]
MVMSEKNYDEGLGTVYERFILNDIFKGILQKNRITSVLEAPIYGMTGITGINSVYFALRGCHVTLVDVNENRLKSVDEIWNEVGLRDSVTLVYEKNLSELPFEDNSFDIVWNFAALQHVENAPLLIKELIRVSKHLIFISIQNKAQMGYKLRKYLLQRDSFKSIYERWMDIDWIKKTFEENNVRTVEDGVFDIPPWPDTCMPVNRFFGDKRKSAWNWNIVDYYLKKDINLRDRIDRYKFIENSGIPEKVKSLWAHHRYVLGVKT